MAIEIVDSMVIFHSYVAVYQRVPGSNVAGRVYEIGNEWTYMKMALQFEGFCLCDQWSASARERCRLHGSIQPHWPMFARMVSQQKYVLCSEWWGRASSVHACLCKGAVTLASPRALKLELEPSLVRSDLTSSHWEKPVSKKSQWGSWSNTVLHGDLILFYVNYTLCNFQSPSQIHFLWLRLGVEGTCTVIHIQRLRVNCLHQSNSARAQNSGHTERSSGYSHL